MDEQDPELLPTSERAIFLLTIPPKSLFHDSHKCVQVQRVVHQSEGGTLRIRPIFNLEYHKMFATRIIELEDDDAKVAEFHPVKGHQENTESGHVPGGSGRRRRRAFSIEGKTGASGGTIASQASKFGLCDVNVTGSEREGSFTFLFANAEAQTWQKTHEDGVSTWQLKSTKPLAKPADTTTASNSQMSQNGTAVKPRTSYEFGRPRDPYTLVRASTSMTVGSQYTTHFNNESQLSGLTETPQVDVRDIVKREIPPKTDTEPQMETRAVLSPKPLPYLRVMLRNDGTTRHSMHSITRENEEIYRILLCTLWITWSTPDFIPEPETQHDQSAGNDHLHVEGVALADRNSKAELSKAVSDLSSDRKQHKSRELSQSTASVQQKPKQQKKPGPFSFITRICGH